jgi:hypothetical protein
MRRLKCIHQLVLYEETLHNPSSYGCNRSNVREELIDGKEDNREKLNKSLCLANDVLLVLVWKEDARTSLSPLAPPRWDIWLITFVAPSLPPRIRPQLDLSMSWLRIDTGIRPESMNITPTG